LREEHRLGVIENKVLTKLFGPKRDEVTGDWRKLHNEELNDLLSSTNIHHSGDQIKKIKCAGHVARMGRMEVRKVFVGKPEGKTLLGRPRRKWKYNMKCIFKKWDWETWTGLI
jgi:hypothetical protein